MASPVEIFCCYAREDQPLLQCLKAQLMPLQRQGFITLWADIDISAGSEWEKELEKHLDTAQVIILLVSPDFMASDYCYSKEMKRAMERHENGEAHIIPIILRPVYWQKAPFGKLQAFPTDAKPVTDSRWHTQDEAFFNIAEGIRRVVEGLVAARVDAQQWIRQADEHYVHKHFEEALAACEQALCLDPNVTQYYGKKGRVLLGLKRYKDALAAYDQCIDLGAKDDPYCYYGKGQALCRLGQYEEALAAYEQAIRLDAPDPDPQFHHEEGVVYQHLAQQAFEREWQAVLDWKSKGRNELPNNAVVEPEPFFQTMHPPMNIAETPNGYEIDIALPDVNPTDIDLRAEHNTLSITGRYSHHYPEQTQQPQQLQYLLRQNPIGFFERVVAFPRPIDATKIEATYQHGLLTLKVPTALG